ncbi:O-antigen ligase family protein [Deinococcus aquatilis]|uniref:O-antigen ligase family protein n=1 Tax=Deinococcus aquatilis TaxID=519440 RepID=UPI003CCB805A
MLALITALLSGSRGPLITALLGILVLVAYQQQRSHRPLKLAALIFLPAALLVFFGALPQRLQGTALQRLGTLDLTGRDLVWNDAFSVIQAFPWSGTGSLLLGPRLAPPGGSCTWFEALEVRGIGCPALLQQVNNTWVIAHNGALQALGETGLIGTAGLFLLLGGAVVGAVTTARPLTVTLLVGLLFADLTDNVTPVPGPFFSEIFWLTAGWALSNWKLSWRVGFPAAAGWGAAILLITAFPLWTSFVPSGAPPGALHIVGLIAPTQWRSDEPYAAAAQFRAPPGQYRAHLRACRISCVTVTSKPFTVVAGQPSAWQWLIGPLPSPSQVGRGEVKAATEPKGLYRLELRLWPGTSSPWHTRSLASRTWTTEVRVSEGQP